ncbi:MAG: FMN-dependent alpha-hydroxy acid dehydrogenase [bacterium]|nr:FMN-dependent alpha-hydroxy acid dehydrogenase [bacterium]
MADAADDKLLTLADYRRAARGKLSPLAWRYFRAGADAEETLRDNRRAFGRWQIWPRVLVDVERRDLATTILGAPSTMPVLIAPTAYHRLAHPDGEAATVRGAAAAGVIACVATLATTSLEEVAVAAPSAPKWFQLYVHRDAGLTREMVARAAAAGYRALCVTVDTPVLGRRVGDERHGFALPPGMPMPNLLGAQLPSTDGSSLAKYFAERHDPAFSWRDLERLRAATALPLVLKGLLRGDDAARAVEHGCAAVIVSNHGGRQLDGVPATLDALPGVVDAVAGRCEVLVDGGVRWGTDVLKALALGARAVLLGRPILWGLAVDGEAGVRAVLELVRAELSRAMALAGCPTLGEITRDLVRPRESMLR